MKTSRIKNLLSVSEATEFLSVSRATLYRMKDEGSIKLYKLRGKTVLKLKELEAFIESELVEA